VRQGIILARFLGVSAASMRGPAPDRDLLDQQPWLPATAASSPSRRKSQACRPSHHSGRRLAVADRYELAVLDGDYGHFLVRRAGFVREVCIPVTPTKLVIVKMAPLIALELRSVALFIT